MRRTAAIVSALLAGLALLAGPARAERHIYSYDSANPATEAMTEGGLSFVFDKSFMNLRVLKVMETNDIGVADLKPASYEDLGHGGLEAVLGPHPAEFDLYQITDQDDGVALRSALCPGSDKGWLLFGRIKSGRSLRVRAIGHDPKSGKSRLCLTLDYDFHGEWLDPKPILPQPDRSNPFNDAPNNLPY